MAETTELIFLPGLGADVRLFAPQAAVFKNLTVPPWIPPHRDESLQEYAARLAEMINPRGRYLIGGVSLGGMIAHEMATHLSKRDTKPSGLVLISTCRTQSGLRGWQRLAPLASILPPAAFGMAKPIAPLAAIFYNRLPADMRRLSVQMFQDADNRFMQWALAAILRWKSSAPADVPTFHIHGRRDRLIRIKNVETQEIIDDGGHLINLTHTEQVNKFIARAAASVVS
ncbi:MAG: alpha/beta hydrolase [Planctomycetota bacterium]|nr:alpha/beta hydrolase [Planctomycetota bacterium]